MHLLIRHFDKYHDCFVQQAAEIDAVRWGITSQRSNSCERDLQLATRKDALQTELHVLHLSSRYDAMIYNMVRNKATVITKSKIQLSHFKIHKEVSCKREKTEDMNGNIGH